MVLDDATRTAIERVQPPVQLLRAERGLFDDEDSPLIPGDELHAFASDHPRMRIEENHYTLVLGDGPGPPRVVAAIERAVG